ncbi:MAG: hypothetical protein P8X46_07520, partial [Nitrospirales bacterium]
RWQRHWDPVIHTPRLPAWRCPAFRQLGIPIALIQPPLSLFPVLHRHGMQELPPVFSHEYDARTMN